MDSRVRTLGVALLFLLGVFLGIFLYPRVFGNTAEVQELQVRQDAVSLIDAVHPGMLLPVTPALPDEFWHDWDKRRDFYVPEQFEELRAKLLLYLEFVEVEWDEALAIWEAGDHTILSDEAKRLHARMKESYGPEGERIVAFFAERIREQAYQASPKVAGYDPDRPFDKWHVVMKEWFPVAKERVHELTQPLD